jgi:glycosyltransferase involved in cell wall biosynthesis
MRVLLATPGTDVGGAERIVLALAHALPRRGHEVVLWGPAGQLEPELAGVPLIRVVLPDRARSPLGVVAGVASLAAAVRRTRPDVVHAHNPRVAGMAAAAVRIARGPRRPPLLATFHGSLRTEYRGAAALFRGADAVTCVSGDVAAGMRAAGLPAARLHIVLNSVVVPLAEPAAVAALDGELGLGGAPVVAILGRLVPQKNHGRFLAAAARVAQVRPDVRFVIVGDGPLRAELTARATALGLDGRLTFTGLRHDAPAFAARADLVAVSSDSEGLPLVVLEALAAGTPVVSTPVEGVQDLGDAGVVEIVPKADDEALAHGIIELMADLQRRAEMGARGRELVAERYSGEAMVDAYERLYSKLSRARPRSRPPSPSRRP